MRRIWVQIHLWLGLTLGAIGILIGLSGSFLVYDEQIDEWLNPQRYAVSAPGAPLGYAEYAASARTAVSGARVLSIRMPDEDGGPIVATVRGRGALFHRIYLDPPTAKVLDSVAGGGFIGWMHRFHENLTLREYWGREIVGAVGIAMLISSLSGLYLWWPARGRFREALGLRAGLTLSRNLHYVLGFYGCVVLALLSFTGIWLAYVDAGRTVVSAFSPVSPRTAVESGAYRVMLRDETLFVEAVSGTVLRRVRAADRTAGDRFLAAQRGLHTGEMLGAARAFLFVGGLLPALLVVTGTMMWLRQRARKYVATSSSDVTAPSEKNLENATAPSAMRR
jgi:uncharacterized iron-regulated membrane protein